MAKEGMDWLTGLFYELTVAIFRCCEHINQRNPQNIAAKKNEPIFIVNEKKEGASGITTHLLFCMLGMSLYPVFLLTPDTGPSTFLKTVQMG